MEPGISYTSPQVKSYQTLCNVEPHPRRDHWVVYSYVLNREIESEKDVYGLIIFLGCYDNKKDADDMASYLTRKTNIKISRTRLGWWNELRCMNEQEKCTKVHTDVEGKLLKMEKQENERVLEQREKQYQKEKKTVEEATLKSDKTTMSYYKSQWLKIINMHKRVSELRSQLKECLNVYLNSVENVQEHHGMYPEHDKDWISTLSKLEYSSSQIESIQQQYNLLKPIIFGENLASQNNHEKIE